MDKYTENDITSIFEEINFSCFDDSLPVPAVTIMDEQTRKVINVTQGYGFDFDGICFPLVENNFLIGIATGLTSDNFYNTVVHEIVHIYCMMKWNYSGHGRKFKSVCQHIIEELT